MLPTSLTTDAEKTIQALKASLQTAQAALDQAQKRNRNFELKLKSFCKQTFAGADLTPKFAVSMLTSFKHVNTELCYERGNS
jgi:hypothetical protein